MKNNKMKIPEWGDMLRNHSIKCRFYTIFLQMGGYAPEFTTTLFEDTLIISVVGKWDNALFRPF
jgi:hypothetical protein